MNKHHRENIFVAGGDAFFSIRASESVTVMRPSSFDLNEEYTMELKCREQTPFTRRIIESGLLKSPFILIDVGVQGGIHPRWESFGNLLYVYGFDPLVEEIAKLRQQRRPRSKFYEFALGNEDGERDFFVSPITFSSSLYRHALSKYDIHPGVSSTASVRRVTVRRLDDLTGELGIPQPDFIKIDVEGHEVEVLRGAVELLTKGVLGIEAESNLNASASYPESHLGALTELLLKHGMVVYDIAFNRVACRSFEARARALKIRDPATHARPGVLNVLFCRAIPRSADEALKLAAILELYGMNDCAYDMVTMHKPALPIALQTADLLIEEDDTIESSSVRRALKASVRAINRALKNSAKYRVAKARRYLAFPMKWRP